MDFSSENSIFVVQNNGMYSGVEVEDCQLYNNEFYQPRNKTLKTFFEGFC